MIHLYLIIYSMYPFLYLPLACIIPLTYTQGVLFGRCRDRIKGGGPYEALSEICHHMFRRFITAHIQPIYISDVSDSHLVDKVFNILYHFELFGQGCDLRPVG